MGTQLPIANWHGLGVLFLMNETKELRGDAPADLVRALDALAMSEGKARNAYINEVLEMHVRQRLHALSLAHRMLAGNPLYPETTRSNQL